MHTARRAQALEAKYAELCRMEQAAKDRDDWTAANALALEAAQVERTLAALEGTDPHEETEMMERTTTAERLAARMGNDGQRWETEDGTALAALCAQYGGHYEKQARPQDLMIDERYVFPDGSAIVISGDCWDIEGAEPFSFAGA